MDSEARSDSDSDYELLTTSFVMPPISALTSGFVTQNAGTNVLLSMPHAVPGEIEAASAASPHDSSSSSHSYDVVPPLPPPCMLTTGFGSSQIRGGGCVGEPLPPPIPRTLSAAGVLETFDKSKIILLDDASDSGGTAMIHRCQIADPRYPDVYILKSQRTEKPNSKWKDYMTREIKFLKLVRGSPYFPQLIGKTSDAIIMTVAEGVDASKWMACRKVPCGDIDVLFKDLKLSDRYEIAFHLAQAFRHSHSLGVTHCDLKPGNFMIKRCAPRGPLLSPFTTPYHTGWVVTVIDFGFAQHPTVGDAVKGGTTFYESPDSVLGSCDTSVDAWAFGMVLGQLLGTEFTASLQNDFDCVRKELMQQAAMNPHVAQRKSRLEKDEFAKMYFSARSKASERSMRTFPVAVRRLMMQCLRYDGSSRPTMEECASTLRRCLEDELCFERLYYHSAVSVCLNLVVQLIVVPISLL
jgi:serine/threonine protein kinase